MINSKLQVVAKKINNHRVAVLFLVIALACGFIFIYQDIRHWKLRNIPNVRCENSATMLLTPLPPLRELVPETTVILVADRESKTNHGYRFKVHQIFKGDTISRGDVIDVCANIGEPEEGSSYDSAVLFLKGLDRNKNVWVPEHYEMGVIPRRGDGTYQLRPKDQTFKIDDITNMLQQ